MDTETNRTHWTGHIDPKNTTTLAGIMYLVGSAHQRIIWCRVLSETGRDPDGSVNYTHQGQRKFSPNAIGHGRKHQMGRTGQVVCLSKLDFEQIKEIHYTCQTFLSQMADVTIDDFQVRNSPQITEVQIFQGFGGLSYSMAETVNEGLMFKTWVCIFCLCTHFEQMRSTFLCNKLMIYIVDFW